MSKKPARLEPCPCGKTPQHLMTIDEHHIIGDCCYRWAAPRLFHPHNGELASPEEAWNAAPRAINNERSEGENK